MTGASTPESGEYDGVSLFGFLAKDVPPDIPRVYPPPHLLPKGSRPFTVW